MLRQYIRASWRYRKSRVLVPAAGDRRAEVRGASPCRASMRLSRSLSEEQGRVRRVVRCTTWDALGVGAGMYGLAQEAEGERGGDLGMIPGRHPRPRRLLAKAFWSSVLPTWGHQTGYVSIRLSLSSKLTRASGGCGYSVLEYVNVYFFP